MFYFCNCTVLFAPLHFFIMAGDDLVDVIHTTITQFGCIFIVDFVEFVFWWEAHTEEG